MPHNSRTYLKKISERLSISNIILVKPSRRLHEAMWGYIFLLPGLFFFSVFYFYPILWSVNISFHKWRLLDTPSFVGISNYVRLFNDPEFINSVTKSFEYTFGTVIPIWVFSLALALVFNRTFRGHRFYLTIYYIPAVVSLTVWCLLWLLMYNPSYGLLTTITNALGYNYVRWLNNPNLAMVSLIILSVVKGIPVYMVVFLAGLRSIPTEYYEAAQIDGANALKYFIYITLPLLKPVFLFVSVVSIIIGFQQFIPAYVVTGGGPGSVTRVLPLFIFETAFEALQMGYASAIAVSFLMILMIITLLQFAILRTSD